MLTSPFAVRTLARRALFSNSALGGSRGMASLDAYEDYGKHVFTGKVADTYLKKYGASGDLLKDPTWTSTHSDVVANAVLDWYVSFFDFKVFQLRFTSFFDFLCFSFDI